MRPSVDCIKTVKIKLNFCSPSKSFFIFYLPDTEAYLCKWGWLVRKLRHPTLFLTFSAEPPEVMFERYFPEPQYRTSAHCFIMCSFLVLTQRLFAALIDLNKKSNSFRICSQIRSWSTVLHLCKDQIKELISQENWREKYRQTLEA